jgi:transposase
MAVFRLFFDSFILRLKEYKAQSGTERGFKFIKDDSFQLDAVFLKTPKRIDALMMVMRLCLMVYGVSQYDLRKSSQETGETIPDQKRKPKDRPSLKWVYYLFFGVHELNIESDGKIKQIVINVNSALKHILGHFGQRAREIYFNSA